MTSRGSPTSAAQTPKDQVRSRRTALAFRPPTRLLARAVRRHPFPPPAGVIERWELLQAQSLSEKHGHEQDLQQWQQLISDLQNTRAWLGRSEAELRRLRGLVHSTDIQTIQQRIRKLKVCLLLVLFLGCFLK